ncbi:pantothenate transporter liz1, partial [Corchorus olitorius]
MYGACSGDMVKADSPSLTSRLSGSLGMNAGINSSSASYANESYFIFTRRCRLELLTSSPIREFMAFRPLRYRYPSLRVRVRVSYLFSSTGVQLRFPVEQIEPEEKDSEPTSFSEAASASISSPVFRESGEKALALPSHYLAY